MSCESISNIRQIEDFHYDDHVITSKSVRQPLRRYVGHVIHYKMKYKQNKTEQKISMT